MGKRGAFAQGELALAANGLAVSGRVGEAPAEAREAMDAALSVLAAHKDRWVMVRVGERIEILDKITRDTWAGRHRWVAKSLEAKGIAGNTAGEAEEWAILAAVMRGLRVLQGSLVEIHAQGRPRIPGPVTSRPDGQVVVQVFPRNRLERLLFQGMSGEVWLEPGVTVEEMLGTQAGVYRDQRHGGKVALVLGAGNAAQLAVIDVLDKLFVQDQVVVLKPNPVMAYLGPLIEEGFRALIDGGFLRVVYGGAAEGAYLCQHPTVDEIHLTGSDKTFEAITFGSGPEGKQRKAEHRPRITKRFTAELGNVSPVIVVPGPWSEGDVQDQAEHLATWLVANAGFGCLTPRVVVQNQGWAQREVLLEAMGQVFDAIETRKAWYPGARERHRAFVAAHPQARQFGDGRGDRLPWTLIPGVDADNCADICFNREAFCSLVAETGLEALGAAEFVDRAVAFANETLWGSLAATILVHPASMADPQVARAVEQAIAELRFGTVTVNAFAFYSYYFMVAPWGAFPGHEIYDIQSGRGKTANALMLEGVQKSVARAPFRKPFDPLKVTSKRADQFARKLAAFEASGSWGRVPGLIWTAVRSRG
ncbi:MAG TPA: aldehyde dehydrogenase family protein, partial [Anaerolineae bacterium]|nr:aldehyde dehydrogenase family protein [Anaerolineae bacterium]